MCSNRDDKESLFNGTCRGCFSLMVVGSSSRLCKAVVSICCKDNSFFYRIIILYHLFQEIFLKNSEIAFVPMMIHD